MRKGKERKKTAESAKGQCEEEGKEEAAEDLFGDSEEEQGVKQQKDEIRINNAFASRYEQRKRRELLSKNKELLEELEEEESTSEEEDEEGELLTPQVEKKLLDVLSLIKRKDPKIYNPNAVFFTDSDFEREEEAKEEDAKPMKFKDVIRKTLEEEGPSAFVDEDEKLEKRKKTTREPAYQEELASLKRSFLEAADAAEAEGEGFLNLKVKGKEEEEEEETEYRQFLDSRNACKGVDSEAVLSRFWVDGQTLDANESFLRDYILNQKWREDKAIPAWQAEAGLNEDEDEQQLEEADAFEASYNFRFEEEGGCEIQGHPRVIAESVRQTEDKRKKARERRNKQKEEERVRREEELKRLKSLKREEIREKLKQIQQVSGLDDATVKSVLNLEDEFDSERHDAEMQRLFDADYETQREGRSCLELPEGCADILSTAHETEVETLTKKQRKLLKLQKRRRRQAAAAEGYAEEEEVSFCEQTAAAKEEEGNEKGKEKEENQQEEPQAEWWLCDGCGLGIKGGKKRFDCSTCENFTLCKICFRNVRHPHRLVRKTVPLHCNPPKDFQGAAAATAEEPAELKDLLNEYFQLDYEDIIGGDLPTRFKYRKVEAANYGFSTEEILNSTDADLNSKVSLKKLATYREYDKKDRFEPKPWLRHRRHKEGELQQEAAKRKKREKLDRRMTAFGIREDRLKAYDA
ncbi:hypothetical protein Efla_001271 [Eimeria flavescens]